MVPVNFDFICILLWLTVLINVRLELYISMTYDRLQSCNVTSDKFHIQCLRVRWWIYEMRLDVDVNVNVKKLDLVRYKSRLKKAQLFRTVPVRNVKHHSILISLELSYV
jgi:hypothetical protein